MLEFCCCWGTACCLEGSHTHGTLCRDNGSV